MRILGTYINTLDLVKLVIGVATIIAWTALISTVLFERFVL
jgi:hypothetical protein